MSKTKKDKKPISKTHKIINWVVTIFFGAIIGVLLVFQITGLATKADNYGVPNYFGYQVMMVLTDSMEPEYPVDTTVITKKCEPEEIKVGDDITFMWDIGVGHDVPMTHRVLEVKEPSEETNFEYVFITHGINKHSNQGGDIPGGTDLTGQTQEVHQSRLMGKVVGTSAFIGFCFSFLTQWYGFLIVLLIPVLYLVISSIIDIVNAVKDDDEDDDKDKNDNPPSGPNPDLLGLSEEDKERLKQELLDELLKEKVKG